MKAQTTNDRAAGRVLRCMLAAILVATAVFAGFSSRADVAYAADESLSDATWEEVKGEIEGLMGTPYVWGGKDTSGWDGLEEAPATAERTPSPSSAGPTRCSEARPQATTTPPSTRGR